MLIAQIKLARIYTQKYVKYVKMVVYYFKGIKLRRLIAKINTPVSGTELIDVLTLTSR